IGDVRMLAADFGFQAPGRSGRPFDPPLGGGALLEVGIYPAAFPPLILGPPSQLTGLPHIVPGLDERAAMVLAPSEGRLAVLHSAIAVNTPQEATIIGTRGRIRLHTGWWMGSAMTLPLDSGGEEFLEFPFTGNGYQFQAIDFMECL